MHNDIMAVGSRDRPPMLAREDMLSGIKPAVAIDEAVPEHTICKTYKNTTHEKHAYFDDEAEAIQMIISGIGYDIYSIVDACTTAKEIWIAIERDKESIESYYSRFYKMMNEIVRNKLEVATMQVNVQFLQQLQQEWNANPLALVAVAQHYLDEYNQAPKSHKTHAPSSRPTSSYRSHAPTRTKGKEIAKPVTPPSKFASNKDNDPKQAQKDKEM
ncbi:hypothetical protein Tco_0907555 [Tanacetum coccineum]|uniref:Gag protein n=1 Tax=Tanacetum coccineum TaxID=301880 RepID=A0ABQ5CKS6_9ASTR